ncbi:WYL domain-containing protein [Flavobacteriaceae bacterium]|nr:WYL domain-containing protein [Flavobacteriaceae bacterium]
MATNKNAIIRYQALDKCFRNTGRKYSILDLIEVCNEALYNFNGTTNGVKRRQVYDDINFMKSEQGYSIELEITKEGRTAYYKYLDPNFSINNQPINETEALQLKEALLTLKRIKGMPQFTWVEELTLKLEQDFGLTDVNRQIIGFENNPFLKGLEHLNNLFTAIQFKKVINVYYRTFKNEAEEVFYMHPQFLKQYNNRWFLLGTNSKYKPVTTLAIDRIVKVETLNDTYEVSDIDFEERYEDIIGVTRGGEEQLETITLKANTVLASYMLTKPLHGSQRNKVHDETGLLFTIDVIPNYELEQQLLSFGEALKVVAPSNFVEKIKNRLEASLLNYQ